MKVFTFKVCKVFIIKSKTSKGQVTLAQYLVSVYSCVKKRKRNEGILEWRSFHHISWTINLTWDGDCCCAMAHGVGFRKELVTLWDGLVGQAQWTWKEGKEEENTSPLPLKMCWFFRSAYPITAECFPKWTKK